MSKSVMTCCSTEVSARFMVDVYYYDTPMSHVDLRTLQMRWDKKNCNAFFRVVSSQEGTNVCLFRVVFSPELDN